jgi:hypothetical protein
VEFDGKVVFVSPVWLSVLKTSFVVISAASPDILKHNFRRLSSDLRMTCSDSLRWWRELLPVSVSSVVNLPVNTLAAETPFMPAALFPNS